MSDQKSSVIIIGAGVVGCAIAKELAFQGYAPIVLEAGPRIAEGTTSRNSGVIHAGIYYKPGSLKAEVCTRGKELLYEWCRKYDVAHLRTGKWIVGAKDDEAALSALFENAKASGATEISWGTRSAIHSDLPEVEAEIGLLSSGTGIVDPYEYSRSFQIAAEERGAMFIMNAKVTGIHKLALGGYELETTRGPLEAEIIINCSGLYADEIARLVGIEKYRIYPCRGDYFRLSSPYTYKRLIYPSYKKGGAGLGVHLTIALDGSYKLGPDVKYVDSKEAFDTPINVEEKRVAFFEAARKYLPHIRLEQLQYDSCGIRPKLRSPDEKEEKDFIISQDLPGFINLMGIESPGLTSSMALAERISALL